MLIPVYFNAPLGGVQSHVRAQADALLGAGHGCTVMCKPGPFADSLRRASIDVVETTFEDMSTSVEQASGSGRYDLVHAHPFQSRAVGIEVAARQRVPFLCTFHGTYLDSLPSYADSVDLCIAVSSAIRDYIVGQHALPPSRILVIPNGVDTDIFAPRPADVRELRRCVQALRDFEAEPDERRILFVSRLDADKRFILDVLIETWKEIQRTRAFDVAWWIAGDGSLRSEVEVAAADVNNAAGREIVHFLGWQSELGLAALYNNCNLAIAPGRSALESMACAGPVIAIGSKGYVGLIDDEKALEGVHGNFGGLGRKHESYQPGSMFEAIDSIIYDDQELARLGRLSLAIVDAFYRQADLNVALLRQYEVLANSGPRSELKAQYAPIGRTALGFADADRPGSLSSIWHYPRSELRLLEVVSAGRLRAQFSVPSGEWFYLQSDRAGFGSPPADPVSWRMDPDSQYRFTVPLSVLEGMPRIMLWVIEYDAARRLRHSVLNLKQGINRVELLSSSATTCFRLLFRLAGSGIVELGPVGMAERREPRTVVVPSDLTLTRARHIPDFHAYQGENLVFVVGPPRSGTTWLLNLLAAHPDVVAATVDNLGVRINEHKTLETNVFNENRPFTDAQIKWKFHLLSQREPGKVIVEKTPVHLLYLNRIRRVFPKAAIVVTERDGRDVVASLVHVGRDRSAWWEGAPDTVEEAAELWRTYAEASVEFDEAQACYRARYEQFLENAAERLTELLTQLGLSTGHIPAQIEACRDGRNIPIPGVFREGGTGGWRKLFTASDVAAFKSVAGDLLVRLGYESDDSWDVRPSDAAG